MTLSDTARSTITYRDGVYYETSRVKDFIEHWFEEHRNDPVYRAGR